MIALAPLPLAVRPRDAAVLVATVCHIGRLRPAPGTWASAAALVLAWGTVAAGGSALLALLTLAAVQLGLWAAGTFVAATGEEDSPFIVIDEVAGQWIAVLPAPLDPAAYLAAFLFFRAFDIAKPWPVSWADRELTGGVGAMSDDLIAGVYAALWIFTLSLLNVW